MSAFNDQSTPLSALATRRSAKARDLVAPGPDADQLDTILAVAARVPDHGKLAPWRFVVVPVDARGALADRLDAIYVDANPTAGRVERQAVRDFAHQAPCLVVALSRPAHASQIPRWEQELSAGAACMNLLHAAHALGYTANWLTTWAAFSDPVRDLFGDCDERIAGFLFVGTASRPLEERPRPELADIVRTWRAPALDTAR